VSDVVFVFSDSVYHALFYFFRSIRGLIFVTRWLRFEFNPGRSPADYVGWVKNHFNWGGENEIVMLARHFKVRPAIPLFTGVRLVYLKHVSFPACLKHLVAGQSL
jgi:hypothetical protein